MILFNFLNRSLLLQSIIGLSAIVSSQANAYLFEAHTNFNREDSKIHLRKSRDQTKALSFSPLYAFGKTKSWTTSAKFFFGDVEVTDTPWADANFFSRKNNIRLTYDIEDFTGEASDYVINDEQTTQAVDLQLELFLGGLILKAGVEHDKTDFNNNHGWMGSVSFGGYFNEYHQLYGSIGFGRDNADPSIDQKHFRIWNYYRGFIPIGTHHLKVHADIGVDFKKLNYGPAVDIKGEPDYMSLMLKAGITYFPIPQLGFGPELTAGFEGYNNSPPLFLGLIEVGENDSESFRKLSLAFNLQYFPIEQLAFSAGVRLTDREHNQSFEINTKSLNAGLTLRF
ncbi:Uncharacterised protein [BD1-7 clade bacterium]|uniref:Outer membrane protein beta-barrel domain-containing protein n=1 Tax=BD1-7 clade bacterium TaxID=2029982 RepID=A0A5S9PN60_9GAMM|nr:Uncharacterised protein [BD1-7 clade bacterium]